jgi:acetyl-CoA carboxylase biotin carboxyl carrier protein
VSDARQTTPSSRDGLQFLDLFPKSALPSATSYRPVDLKDIKAIIDLMRKNDLSVFELEKDGFKLKLQKGPQGQPILTTPIAIAPGLGGAVPAAATAALPERGTGAEGHAESGGPFKDITSPMVGTFYCTPSPESPPFVDVGATVNEDTVVCIIEAMKVMNEIKAETSGIISEVLVENGKPVQFGQALFRVR